MARRHGPFRRPRSGYGPRMTKRVAILSGAALILGIMTSTIGFAVAPDVLRLTGPALCESGRRFAVHEGPTVDLPENRRGAPVRFSCVAPDGRESEAHIGRSVFVLFLVSASGWYAVLAWAVRRLLAGAGAPRDVRNPG